MGAAYCAAVGNGTIGLYLALKALGVGSGDEVILPAFTFSGSVLPVLQTGANPVFVDVDPSTYCMTPDTVRKGVSRMTKAVMLVSLHGYPLDPDQFRSGASLPSRVSIIEDACQAHGSEYAVLHPRKQMRVGTRGSIGVYSLNQTKVLPGGEGGLVVTDNSELDREIRMMRTFGEDPDDLDGERSYEMVHLDGAGNWRMDELCSLVALSHAPHVFDWTQKARENAQIVSAVMGDFPDALPDYHVGHSWQKYRMWMPKTLLNLPMFMEELREAGVPCVRWQHKPVSQHSGFTRDTRAKYENHVPSGYTVSDHHATKICHHTFCLFTERYPLHAQHPDTVREVAERMRSVYKRHA